LTDPRIRARRIAVQRDLGRHRLRLLVAALVPALLVTAGLVLLQSPVFAVDRVVVVGDAHAPIGRVLRAGGLEGHPQLVDVNTASVSHRIETLPWVLRAEVFRDWPSSVRIVIVDRVPVAAIAVGGAGGGATGVGATELGATGAGATGAGATATGATGAGATGTHPGGSSPPTEFALVDRSGRVLARVPAKPHGLLVVSGLGEPGAPGSLLGRRAVSALAVAAGLPKSLVRDLRSIETVSGDAADVTLTLANGVGVLLGPANDLRAKFVALATVLQRVNLAGVATVDLRVPSAPVLTPVAPS
jgi:cell division septal protein FtsQ